jgi:hypothetical protein
VRPHIGFGPPPEIFAPATPLRVAPADPGGLTVPEANVPIMSGATFDAPPQLAPPPPPPDLTQLQAISGESPPAPAPASPLAVAPAPAPHVSLNGPIEAQLATVANKETAEKLWLRLSAELPDTMRGKIPEYVPAMVNGQNLYRLSTGGFADMAAARAFCVALTAKGAACTVAAF